MTISGRGVALSLASSVLFVTLPGYIHSLEPLTSVQVIAHRVVWSIPMVLLLVLFTRQGGVLRDAGRRLLREVGHTGERGGGFRVQAARDAPGPVGQPSGLDAEPHGGGHRLGVLRAGDGRRQQHGVAAQLHRQRGVARGADAGVEDHRHVRLLDDQLDVVGIADAEP